MRGTRSWTPWRWLPAIAVAGVAIGAAVLILWEPSPPAATRVLDLDGRPTDPLGRDRTVLLFVRTDCPVSNRYAPEIARLARQFEGLGVPMTLVYPDPDETGAVIRAHLAEYGLADLSAVRDPDHVLVAKAGARVTPEAVVFWQGEVVYRGRIDDTHQELGRFRAVPTTHDLADAVAAVSAGTQPAVRETKAIGCYIPALRAAP